MPDTALLQLEGAPAVKPFKRVPLTTQTFFSGLVTQRSPFNSMDNRYNRKYLGGRPDQLIDGLNTELTNYGTIIRRPGNNTYTPGQFVVENTINSFYSFHQLTGTITLVMDATNHVYLVTPTAYFTLFTKTTPAQTYFQGVGNTLYMSDGLDLLAWTPSFPVRNWGIVAPSPSGTVHNYAGTAADAGGGFAWSAPVTNAQGAPDGSYTADVVTAAANTIATGNPLFLTNYSLGAAAGLAITGVQVALTASVISGGSSSFNVCAVNLLYNGIPIGHANSFLFTGSLTTVTAGGSNDTWGASLNTAIIDSSLFGIQVVFSVVGGNAGNTFTIRVDAAQITVFLTGAPTATPTGAGSLTTTNGGWQYVYAYGNTASGHISNPTFPSASTGNFANKASVNVPVVASTDPQVNAIRVYRTKDGGSVFYELPTSPYPNTSTTIVDTSTDATLNTLVFWPAIPYVSNAPPPASSASFPTGLVKMAYHLGRIWGAVGNYVYYSAGPDIVLGNGSEAFPPANFFLFPSQVNRLVPYSSGLLVFTTDDVFIILGTSLATFYAMPFQQGVGLLSYNALDVQGTTIFLYSSDRQALALSSSGVNEIGYAIGNVLQNDLDPSLAYVASLIAGTSEKAVFYGDGSTGWFRCNWNQPPEGGPAWSPQAVISKGCLAPTAIETTPGVHQLLFGQVFSGQTYVCNRSFNVFSDLGVGYDAYASFGSFVLAHPGQAAEIESVVVENTNVGSVPTLGVLVDEISGTFETLPNFVNDPPELTPSLTLMSNRWYLAQGANAARLRHMQVKIDFGSSDIVKNELLTTSLFGGLIHQT
jgi:hypothetical protein